MPPPPPNPPLFPSPPLSRSAAAVEFLALPRFRGPRRVHDGVIEENRKSTRLNSSHMSISYAVFCLKKKKKKKKKETQKKHTNNKRTQQHTDQQNNIQSRR